MFKQSFRNLTIILTLCCFLSVFQPKEALCAGTVMLHIGSDTVPSQFLASFKTEIAATPEELSKGLMFKEFLPENEGMLFDFQKIQVPAMGMKNTIIPLDILFIDDKGIIIHIAENTVPYSEELITPARPCRYALEINAGLSAKYGIKTGQKMLIGRLR